MMPDAVMLWLPSAVAAGVWLHLTRSFNVILATGPSFTSFIVGAVLKHLTGKPLVLDVRDAWTADPAVGHASPYLRKVNKWLERFSIQAADRVISTNPFVTEDFRRRYADRRAKSGTRIYDTIFNGYDADDYRLVNIAHKRRNDSFTIVHTGRLYVERTPQSFLKALAKAFQERPEMRAKTRVLLVGSCEAFLDGKTVDDYVADYCLDGAVRQVGYMSRIDSLRCQAEADLLLLIIGIVKAEGAYTYGISGKLFDYVASQRPILALADEGATRDFLVNRGLAATFRHREEEEIAAYLRSAFSKWDRGEQVAISDSKYLDDCFEFRNLTCRLAHHLSEEVVQ